MSAILDRPSQVLLASASRSVTTSSPEQNYAGGKGAMFTLNVTVSPANGAGLDVQFEVKDPVSGRWVQFSDFAPVVPEIISGNATFLFIVYPGEAGPYTALNTQHLASPLPGTSWRATVVPEVGAFTFSLAAVFLP